MSGPPADGPAKPTMGAACNGCGVCCIVECCPLATIYLGVEEQGPCPALEWEAGRAWCGLARRPFHYAPTLAGKLGAAEEGRFGEFVLSMLGDGSCDSGPAFPGLTGDDSEGLTALEVSRDGFPQP